MKTNAPRIPADAGPSPTCPGQVGQEAEQHELAAAEARHLLQEQATWILRTASSIAKRKGIGETDVTDFAGWVIVRMMLRDYALLRACRQPEQVRRYLRSVIRNLLKDYCNHLWGKWRPSSAALRLGATAVDLERLCKRDGWPLREAIEIMRSDPDLEATPDELEDIASRLPHRSARVFVELDNECHGCPPEADERLEKKDQQIVWTRVLATLKSALASLEAQDLEILRLHFEERHSIAAIAQTLELDQRSLYSRRDRCLKRLRRILHQEGLCWQSVAPTLACESQEAFSMSL